MNTPPALELAPFWPLLPPAVEAFPPPLCPLSPVPPLLATPLLTTPLLTTPLLTTPLLTTPLLTTPPIGPHSQVLSTMPAGDELAADGDFVQIAADPAHRIPGGWVLNKPRLVPALLGDACAAGGVRTGRSQLVDDAAYRAQMLKEVLSSQRATRDRAKGLAAAMPAALALGPLRAFGASATIISLGGTKVLADVAAKARSGELTTTSEVSAKVYLAVATASSKMREGRAKTLEAAGREFRELIDAHANALAPIGFRPTAALLPKLRAAHPSWLWLQSSAVLFSNLPPVTTPSDLVSASEGFTAEAAAAAMRGAEPPVSSLDPVARPVGEASRGLAYVDLGSEGAAERLLEQARRAAGLPLLVAAEAARWEAQLVAAHSEFDALSELVDAAKAAEAEAEAKITAKRDALGATKFKAFEKSAAGKELKAAKSAAVNSLIKPGAASDNIHEPLAKRFAEAKRALDVARAGRRAYASTRAELGAVSVEACAKGLGVEPRRRFTMEHLDELHATGLRETAEKAGAAKKLAELRPYVEKLRQAEARDLKLDMVDQSGFQELFALERGSETTATCPICYETVGTNSPMVTTPCAHLFCRGCMLSWMAAQNVMLSDAQRQGAASTSKLCPCCRHPFTVSHLIELIPETATVDETSNDGTSGDAAAGSSSSGAGASSSAAGASSSSSGLPLDDGDGGAPPLALPTYSSAYTLKAFRQMPMTGERFRNIRVGRCPSISPVLLGHMMAATGLHPGSSPRTGASIEDPRVINPNMVDPDEPLAAGEVQKVALSAKVRRLLTDLENLGVDEHGVPLKVVVFSQHRQAVKHVDFVLAHANVPHVTICKVRSLDEISPRSPDTFLRHGLLMPSLVPSRFRATSRPLSRRPSPRGQPGPTAASSCSTPARPPPGSPSSPPATSSCSSRLISPARSCRRSIASIALGRPIRSHAQSTTPRAPSRSACLLSEPSSSLATATTRAVKRRDARAAMGTARVSTQRPMVVGRLRRCRCSQRARACRPLRS